MSVHNNLTIPLPRSLYLEVTNRCNLRCRTCLQFSGIKEGPRDLSFEEVREIVNQVPGLGTAYLHGIGEPLLHGELREIIGFLKKREIYVLFNTNALLLDEEWAEKLVASGLDELRISLDAATGQTYSKVRGSDQFLRVIENIAAFVRMRKSARRSTPRVSIWLVATGENIEDLPGMIKLAARLHIDEVYLQRLVYQTDGPGYGLAKEENAATDPSHAVAGILRESVTLSDRLGVSLMASGLVSPAKSLQGDDKNAAPWRQCRRPWEVAYITASGNVLPCCISPFSTVDYSSIILGNVFKESLAQIWQGEKFRTFREKHQSEQPPECCCGCGVRWSV